MLSGTSVITVFGLVSQEFLNQLAEVQPLLDVINSEGAELSEVTPGDASLRVEDLIHKDNKRFDNLREQIEKRAEKARLAREKSREVRDFHGASVDFICSQENELCILNDVRALYHLLLYKVISVKLPA